LYLIMAGHNTTDAARPSGAHGGVRAGVTKGSGMSHAGQWSHGKLTQNVSKFMPGSHLGAYDGACFGYGFAGGFAGGYPWNSYAYGNGWWPYTLGHVPVPPYFSLHPPVYYSYPVPRTYGYSPYPYPGHFQAPEIAEVQPEEIINPHVMPETKKAVSSATDTASSPWEMITNPFVSRQLPPVGRVAAVHTAP